MQAPKYSLCHIIWNVFLVDKEFTKRPEIADILREQNVKYIIAILPNDSADVAWLEKFGVDLHIMRYDGHDTYIDKNEFDT